MTKKVLILGGHGYIGSRLQQVLSQQYTVDIVDTNWYNTNQQEFLADYHDLSKDYYANYDVIVGYCTNQDTTDGSIYVNVQNLPWYPNIELLDTSATVTMPTTPTILKPPTTVVAQGFTYDSSTGIITVGQNGDYTFVMMLNALANSANKLIYFYIEVDTGSGFAIRQYSGRARGLQNNVQDQLNIVSANYFMAGTRVRFYLWASGSGVTLNTQNIPGTSTATVPALRLLWA